MKNVLSLVAVVVVAVLIVIALSLGVTVEVKNVGTTTLEKVVVKVAGATYELGDLAAGETESVRVSPTGTVKRVELTWKHDGRDGYGQHEVIFEERGYHGTVQFEVDGIAVKKAVDDLETGFF